MNKNFTRIVTTTSIFFFVCTNLPAQCPGGYSAAELNWDHLDFLPSNNVRYTSFYPTAAFPYNQNFVIGTRRLNMTMAPTATLTLNGENGTNTAHAGSFATAGDDVQFTTTANTNSTITFTFDADVANIQFCLFDIDNNQRATVTATNNASVAQNITITKANAGSGITIAGSGTTSASGTGNGTNYADNDNMGTINVRIDGPVKQVIITLNNAAGDCWLSDIDACVTGAFPLNYQQISRPFTGQPQYVITVVNNNVYYVDPNSGRGYFLFNEPGHDRLNSMAYDPYRRIVYYTYSLTDRVGLDPRIDKTLKKYDVDTKTISVVIPNVNTFGIPTYESGVESGAATFYNGSLYLGVEGYTGTSGTGSYAAGRKSTIWKIDFDAAGNPIAPAAQVFGVTSDNGIASQNIHDWSDFGISDGILYDFDGSNSGDIDFYQFDMMTGQRIRYAPVGLDPKQVSIGWDEKLYDVDARIALYNGTNGVTAPFTITAPLGPAIPGTGSWGDAAGPYRPFLDFGDAPASYDPDPWSPACHDTLTPNVAGRRTKLILGPQEDVEWLKKGFTTVEDRFEDGLAFVPLFSPITGAYNARVSVLNTTGANATVCAWLDYNGNGLFDAGESAIPATVASLAAPQLINLIWPSTPSTLPNGSYTYLRIRITAASFGMTAANATGYYSVGEVEDYIVRVEYYPLPITLLSFQAKPVNETSVLINWAVEETAAIGAYEVERSINGVEWENVTSVIASGTSGTKHYNVNDDAPYKGQSWYRLRWQEQGGSVKYSDARQVQFTGTKINIQISPNPASSYSVLNVNADRSVMAQVSILSISGVTVYIEKMKLEPGYNQLVLPIKAEWPTGTYIVQLMQGEMTIHQKLVIRR